MLRRTQIKILLGTAMTLIGAATAIAVTRTPSVKNSMEEACVATNFAHNDKEKREAKIKCVVDICKAYLPAVGIACLGAYAAIKAYDLYSEDLDELGGDLAYVTHVYRNCEKGANVEYFLPEDTVMPSKQGEILLYEPYTEQLILTTHDRLDSSLGKVNKLLHSRYECKLNKFLKMIGGKTCTFGDLLGWSCYNDRQMDIWKHEGPLAEVELEEHQADKGMIYVMNYNVDPMPV